MPACGLGCTDPQPEDLSKYYRDYHGGRHGITSNFCTDRRIRILEQQAGKRTGKRLLDIGCGEGTFLLAAKAEGWSVAGTEMNPSAARAAGLEVHPELSAVRALAPFDCITLWHSLEHMPDPRATLREARGFWRRTGSLSSRCRTREAFRLASSVRSGCTSMCRAIFIISTALLSGSLLQREGFATVREWHQEFEYDLLGWSQSALNYGPTAPNLFFDLLTGRKPDVGPILKIFTWVAGSVLTGFSILLVPMGTI